MLNRRGNFRDAPPHLKLLIHQAYETVCRQQAWALFQWIPEEISEKNDRRVVDAWNEALFAGYEPAEQRRARVVEARARVAILDRLRYVIQQQSDKPTFAGEKAIVAAAARIPDGYGHGLSARVEMARRRVTALQRLAQVTEANGPEAAFVTAMRAVDSAGCRTMVPQAMIERAELAMRRIPVLQALGAIEPDLPIDKRDARLLQLWSDSLLRDAPEADAWRADYLAAVARKKLLAQLQAAIQSRDELAIAEIVKQPPMAGYPLSAGWTELVRKACQSAARLKSLLAVLEEGKREDFPKWFDARLIRRRAELFTPHQALLGEWTAADLLAADAIGLGLAPGKESLLRVDEPGGNCRAQWTWPPPRFADRCLLGICTQEPQPGEDPQSLPLLMRMTLDRAAWQENAESQLLAVEPDWADAFVAVWGVIDLGFQTLTSHPLVLGRIEGRSRWPWKKWSLFGSKPQRAAAAEGDEP